MKFAWIVILLVLLFTSTMDARRNDEIRRRTFGYGRNECTPCKEYQLSFKERTITDYAILENSIAYDLTATTVCFFARHTDNKEPQNQCVYSYTDADSIPWANVLTFSISPLLEVIVDRDIRYADVGLDLDTWNHICFTWSSANGDYRFYKDGMVVGSGSGMAKGHKITSGGTTVIAQEQDTMGGSFEKDQAFVGDVTEVNVWGVELSESDIVAQYQHCHITLGSVNEWRDFKDGVRGGTEVIEPSALIRSVFRERIQGVG